jgi:molecular chaperone Hsp33
LLALFDFDSMSLKEDFLHRDRLIRGISDDKLFKITVVKTSSVVRDAQTKHGLSPLAAVILGQSLTGGLLLASTLKGEERLTIRIEGDGPVGNVIVEANAVGAVRGYVGHNDAALPEGASDVSLADGLGNGMLSVAKVLYNEARPVTGTVGVNKDSVQEALAHYIRQSEQVESALLLDVDVDENGQVTEAGGILVQALPNAPLEGMVALQQALESLPRISSLFKNRAYYIDGILNLVGKDIGARELNRMLVDFFCSCTEESFIRALTMLDLSELKEMAGTQQELVCHYCNKKYPVSAEKMTSLYHSRKAALN